MDSSDKTRRFFLISTIVLGVLIIAGLIWAIAMGPGESEANIDPNIVFNDEGAPVKGLDDAKVVVRIFSDFQCPACKVAEQYLETIIPEYQDRVKFIWNDFPLPSLHKNAIPAAIAARCAQEQSNFWEYIDVLYKNQAGWSELKDSQEYFLKLAEQLGLQEDGFEKCLVDDSIKIKVNNDYQEAVRMGLDSTPTFFINRKKISGVMNDEQWREELDKLLK